MRWRNHLQKAAFGLCKGMRCASKFVAGVLMVFGIGIIALPTGIWGASMTMLMLESKTPKKTLGSRCGESAHFIQARFCHRCGERMPE